MATPYVPPTEQLVVEVYVRNLERSVDFYRRLGFEVLERHGRFAALTREGHRFFLDERPDLEPPASPRANVRVMVPDVDAWWRHATGLAARVVTPIANRDYGLRDFTIADPDGFGVRFATRIGGAQEDSP
jgi:catechol 2,3-dioxygenase-like lactoylglutathione lyase family enzyme